MVDPVDVENKLLLFHKFLNHPQIIWLLDLNRPHNFKRIPPMFRHHYLHIVIINNHLIELNIVIKIVKIFGQSSYFQKYLHWAATFQKNKGKYARNSFCLIIIINIQ